MATDPKSRRVGIRWAQAGYSGSLVMSKGTLQYLGLKAPSGGVEIKTYQQEAKSGVTRTLYPGGPSITYSRKAKQVMRVMSVRASTAKSARVLVLETENARDTVRYTGNTAALLQWLNANVTTSQMIVVYGPNGNTYAVLGTQPSYAADAA